MARLVAGVLSCLRFGGSSPVHRTLWSLGTQPDLTQAGMRRRAEDGGPL